MCRFYVLSRIVRRYVLCARIYIYVHMHDRQHICVCGCSFVLSMQKYSLCVRVHVGARWSRRNLDSWQFAQTEVCSRTPNPLPYLTAPIPFLSPPFPPLTFSCTLSYYHMSTARILFISPNSLFFYFSSRLVVRFFLLLYTLQHVLAMQRGLFYFCTRGYFVC